MNNVVLAKDNGETLSEHTLRCFQVADILLDKLPFADSMIETLRNDLKIALAVHDVGKAATGFQKVLRKEVEKWGHRHEIISAAFASSLSVKDEVLLAVITHHKPLPADGISANKGCLPDEEIPIGTELTPIWNQIAKEWEQNISAFQVEWEKITATMQRNDLNKILKLSPLSMDKSWLRRSKQARRVPFERRLYASILRGILISSDHLASNTTISIESMPRHIPILKDYSLVNQSLRDFQKRAGDVKGHLILRAPTGSGKTLAALLWAQRNQKKNGRLFYVLPNIASINAMYERLRDNFGDNVGLLHSRAASSLYSIFESDNNSSSKLQNQRIATIFSHLAREMWFPIRVCTPHQILRYSLHGKGWETMLSEFPNSCFIFDEVHAYDPTITGLTVATAKYLTKQDASCLFLSATMPAFLRKILEKELAPISFLEPSDDPSDQQIINQKRHAVEIIDGNIISNIDLIIKEAEKAHSTLVICNHVPTAQKVYEEIKRRIGGAVLLHSRFCKRDRNKIEQQIIQSLPKVLVSTQVVEVSLDIDFEQGFSEPAPVDALVQRFGRINRRGKRPPATIRIFNKQLHGYDIYDKVLVNKSLQEFSSLVNPLGEQDLVQAADRVYEDGYSEDAKSMYEQALNHDLIREFEKNLVAGVHYEWVEEVIDRSDGTVELLPSSLLGEYTDLENKGLRIEADSLLVPVRVRRAHALSKYLDKLHDPWIIKMPYSATTGLQLDVDEIES